MKIKFLVLFITITTLLAGYQNCSHSAVITANSETAERAIILNDRTLVYSLSYDPSRYTMDNIKLKGSYTYPSVTKKEFIKVNLSQMNTFYSCTKPPEHCDVTIQIPSDYPEMDLSKIYSEPALLSLILPSSNKHERTIHSIKIDKTAFAEINLKKDSQ